MSQSNLIFGNEIMSFVYYKTVSKLNGKVYFIKMLPSSFMIVNLEDQTIEKMNIVYPAQIFNFYEYLITYKVNRFNKSKYAPIEATERELEEIKKVALTDYVKTFSNHVNSENEVEVS